MLSRKKSLGTIVAVLCASGIVFAQEPIQNWVAPPFWAPSRAVRVASEGDLSLQAVEVLPSAPLPFVAISPCRLLDTRNNLNPLGGGGVFATDEIRTYTLPGACGLPAGIQAVSLNVTATNTGSGAFGHIKVWPADGVEPNVSTLNYPGAGATVANAAVVPLSSTGAMKVKSGNAGADVILDVNGYYGGGVVTTLNSLSGDVTLAAGSNVTITPSGQTLTVAATSGPGGSLPVGTANQTLRHNGSAWVANSNLTNDGNTVTTAGSLAVNGILKLPDPQTRVDAGPARFLYSDTSNLFLGNNAGGTTGGERNTGFGNLASLFHTAGVDNTAVGYRAMNENQTGNSNTAVGSAALDDNDSGSSNIAIGWRALSNISTGNSNIGIGVNVGTNVSTGSNNIYIGNAGFNNESGQIRIGEVANITSGTVIVGISGFGVVGGAPVYVNGGGRLATVNSSSRRYKEEIENIGAQSDGLMDLRPVAFKYKAEYDESRQQQYGLIAEEVAEIYPELVVYDKEGKPAGVRYHLLDPLLLNEIQKQRSEIEELKTRLAKLEGKSAP